MSNSIQYQIHDEYDRQGSDCDSVTPSPSQSLYSGTEAEVDFSSEEEGEWRKHTTLRKRKDRSHNTDTIITPRNTKEPNPDTTNNANENSKDNIIKIFSHIIKGGNPRFLKATCSQHNIQMPLTHCYGFKTKISTLIFETHTLAHKFVNTINPNNFGPKAYYQIAPNKNTSHTPRDTTQDWNAVIKGVDPDITEEEFASELDSQCPIQENTQNSCPHRRTHSLNQNLLP